MSILHLTHTDFRFDNRILKEIEAIEQNENQEIYGFGVKSSEKAASSRIKVKAELFNFKLLSNRVKSFPRVITYSLFIIELTIIFFWKAIKIKPRVIHCHDTMVLPVGVFLKLLFKSKLIYDAHELESNKNGQNLFLSKFTYFLEKLFWNKIDILISVSDSILKWYNQKLGDKESYLILNSPVINSNSDDNFLNVTSDYLRTKFNIPEDVKIFIYVGELRAGRSIEIILELFSRHEVTSHVIFLGFGELDKEIMLISATTSKVHLHEPVSHDLVVPIVKCADIGLCLIENVSLSDYYCLPNKFFEYIFSSLYVVVPDFPELKDVVTRYKLGSVTKTDFNSLLTTILTLQDMLLLKKVYNISELSWQTQARRLKNLYTDLR